MKQMRWRITGTMTTTAPMHIGNGNVATNEKLLNEKNKKHCDVQAVVKDHSGTPCIPGTALKGVLRAWANEFFKDDPRIDHIFGLKDVESKSAESGWAEFCTVRWIAPAESHLKNCFAYVPYWNAESCTGIASHVAINRQTGAAYAGKLYFEEFVPESVSFNVEIDATRLNVDDIAFLLAVLEHGAAHETHPYQFGANGADGWGRVKWSQTSVKYWDGKSAMPTDCLGFACCTQEPTLPVVSGTNVKPEHAKFELALQFNGPFLVNDTSRGKRKEMSEDEKRKHTDFTPLRRANGDIWLPASSFRGALRSRAEFLATSIGNTTSVPALFGETSRAARLAISEFVQIGGSKNLLRQDFVAIDRFTGGAADGAKFDAEYADKPNLKTTLVLDTKGLSADDEQLLAAVLNDVREGRLTFGFGASKGYGVARGELCEAGKEWIRSHLTGRMASATAPVNRLIERLARDQKKSDSSNPNTPLIGTLEYKRTKQGTFEWTLKPTSGRTAFPKDPIVDSRIPRVIGTYNVRYFTENAAVVKIELAVDAEIPASVVKPRINGFHNPYYFVSAMDRKSFTDDLRDSVQTGLVGHHAYFQGYFSGSFRVKLTTATELLICERLSDAEAERKHKTYSMRVDDKGRPMLASSSVRGMLRSAYEAITNSRFGMFPEQTHANQLEFRPPGRGQPRQQYPQSPLQLLPDKLRPAKLLAELSPADRVFGWVAPNATPECAAPAYRSQLRVGPVTCENTNAIDPTSKTLSILAQPKPAQGRFYLGAKQPDGTAAAQQAGIGKEQAGYRDGNRIRGPKVYPHHRQGVQSNAFAIERSDQNRSITGCVKTGVEFEFTLSVTNLSEVELGALIWLLDLPEEHYLRLGLGKPLGFGSVGAEIIGAEIAKGEDWIACVGSAETPEWIELMPLKREFEETMKLANPELLEAYKTSSKGFPDWPIEYPNLSGEVEHFRWFMENERGRRWPLPDLTAGDPSLPRNPGAN